MSQFDSENEHLNMYEGDDLTELVKLKIARLLVIVDRVRDLYSKPDNRMAIKGLEHQMKEIQLTHELRAGMEKDDKGKGKYTNADQRKARALETLKDDEEYLTITEKFKELRYAQDEIDDDKKVMLKEIDILKIVVPALCTLHERESLTIKLKNGETK